MKKIMSVFTSAVMALCIVSVFLTAAVTSSEEGKNILTAGTESFEDVAAARETLDRVRDFVKNNAIKELCHKKRQPI